MRLDPPRHIALALGFPLAVALALTACGSSAGTNSAGSNSAAAASASGTTIATRLGADGTAYLTDASGRAVYLWVADTSGSSTCSGACAAAWPPVTTKGTASASGSARAADLGTTKRADGALQVTYHGHPLYYFAGDSSADATNGQGSDGFGAKWWLLTPAGSAITGSGSAGGGAAPSAAGDSAPGYTY